MGLFSCHSKLNDELLFSNNKTHIYLSFYNNKQIIIKHCLYDANNEINNLQILHNTEGVLKLFKHTKKNGKYILYITYCEGGDLYEWFISKTKLANIRLDMNTIKIILNQIIKIVRKCHKQNIIHCDLKLDNIALKEKNNINTLTLIDFGSSININKYNMNTHQFIISPQYASPELCQSKLIPTNELIYIDYWAIGIIAFILVAGHYPIHKKVNIKCDSNFKHVIGPIQWENETFDSDFSELLHGLLNEAVNKRYNDETILHNKWLQS